jgi:hypothetical protein
MSSTALRIGVTSADGIDRISDFKVFTRAMEIEKSSSTSGDGKTRIKCIASSSIEDRHGDTITEGCIRGMAKQAIGMTIFRNHSYRVPQDVFGFVESAKMRKMTVGEAKDKGVLPDHITSNDKTELAFLELGIVVDDSNDDANKTVASLENGVTLGVSIGAIILDYDEKEGHEDEWFPPMLINEVELLEASVVGIPANPLSWVEGATKALAIRKGLEVNYDSTRNDLYRAITKANEEAKAEGDEEDEAEEQPEAEKAAPPEPNPTQDDPAAIVNYYRHLMHDELEEGEEKPLSAKEMRIMVADALNAWQNTRPSEEEVDVLIAAIDANEPLAVEADSTKDADADSSGEESGDADDTDAQEAASGSDPENAEGTDPAAEKAQAEVSQLLEEGVVKSLTDATALLEKTMTRLIEAETKVAALEQENSELKDQLRTADQNVLAAVDFVKKLMDMPLARKSAVQVEAQAFSRQLESVYGEEVLKLLQLGKGSTR